MGQRVLLAVGVVLLIGAVAVGAVGAVGASLSGWTPASTGTGMMGRYHAQVPAGQAISMDNAQQAVAQYLAGYGGSDLVLDELIEFQDNFYAIVKEKSSGTGAFELLVNRVTGAVAPEPGPNMMWNTRYGMMGGAGIMMGVGQQPGPMTVSKDRAAQIAQSWLDVNQNGAAVEEPDAFFGYYTVHFKKDGKVAGMLSVNGYSGQVWYHSWHGGFIQEKEIGS